MRFRAWAQRWRSWVLRRPSSLLLRCLRRFVRIDGRNRAITIAGQAFITLIPLLILTASAVGRTGGRGVGEHFVAQFRLSGDSATAMLSLFTRPPSATGAMSVVGLVLVLASLLSLSRSLQRTYEAAWGLTPGGVPGTVNGVGGVLVLIMQIVLLASLASALRGVPAGGFIRYVVQLALAVPLWLLLQYLLLSRRVRVGVLLPGAVFAAAGQFAVMVGSAVWMPRVIATDAGRYGLIGVALALISWLVVVALMLVAGAVVGVEIAAPNSPGPGDAVRSAKRRS
jgi:membrane protein